MADDIIDIWSDDYPAPPATRPARRVRPRHTRRARRTARRITRAALCSLLVAAVGVAVAPAAQAQVVCVSKATGHYIYDGPSWSPNLAWEDMRIEVCTDGRQITATNAWLDSGMTAAGVTSDFFLAMGPAYRVTFNSGALRLAGYSLYRANGNLRNCASLGPIKLWCSLPDRFTIAGAVHMAAYYWGYCPKGWFTLMHRCFAFTWAEVADNSSVVGFE